MSFLARSRESSEMALIRGFTQMENMEEGETFGRVPLPSQVIHTEQFFPGYPLQYAVIRLKGTGQRPYLLLHRPDHPPWISPMEAVFETGVTVMTDEGHVILTREILDWTKIIPTDILEVKVLGGKGAHWLVLRNRGEYHFLGRGVFPGRGAYAEEVIKANMVKAMVSDPERRREEERRKRMLRDMMGKQWQRKSVDY